MATSSSENVLRDIQIRRQHLSCVTSVKNRYVVGITTSTAECDIMVSHCVTKLGVVYVFAPVFLIMFRRLLLVLLVLVLVLLLLLLLLLLHLLLLLQ